MAVPSFATDYQSTYNFWNWAYDNSWFLGKAIIGFSVGNVCQASEDGLHHATTHSGGGGSVDGQRVYNCVCDYCGESFTALDTDLKNTYNVIINNNNYNSVNSNDCISLNLDWLPRCLTNEAYGTCSIVSKDTFYYNWPDWATSPFASACIFAEFSVDHSCNLIAGTATFSCDNGHTCAVNSALYAYVDGALSNQSNYVHGELYELKPGVTYRVQYNVCVYCCDGINVHVAGNKVWLSSNNDKEYISTPSSFAPSFTYEDGDVWQVYTNGILIDETNLTYYNPVTNTTTNIQNWSYDYSDRSYTVLTDSNNTTTITYGDEYITINEGDNITYNIYYYTESDSSGGGSGSGSGSGSDGDNSGSGTGIWDKIGELFGSLLGGLIDLITGVIDGILDSLISLVKTTLEKLGEVVNLFGSFGDALRSLWAWLPDEIITILVAGVSVVVFASVLKLFI